MKLGNLLKDMNHQEYFINAFDDFLLNLIVI